MPAAKHVMDDTSDSSSDESVGRLPSPPKRARPEPDPPQSHDRDGLGTNDDVQEDSQSHGIRRSGRNKDTEGSGDKKKKKDKKKNKKKDKKKKDKKQPEVDDGSDADGDVESEEETTKANAFDKFGSMAVYETVTHAAVPHVDFDSVLKPKPHNPAPKPIEMTRKVLLAKTNAAGPRRNMSDDNDVGPSPAPSSSPEPEAMPAQHAPPPTQPMQQASSDSPAARPTNIAHAAETALQLIPGFTPGPRHRFKAADYCGDSKQVILRASRQYEAYIISRDPFPDAVKQRVWVQNAWVDACQVLGVNLDCDDNARKLIVGRGSRIRGEMIKTTRSKVIARFRFRTSKRQAVLSQNRKQHDSLIKDNSYLYQDEKTGSGYCHSRLILTILEETLFSSQDTSFGVVYREYLDPLPVPTIALVYTMVLHTISEWSTGHYIHKKFSEGHAKRSMYEPHLRLVKDWDDDEPSTTRKMRARWYKKIWALAGFDDVDTPVITVSEQARLKAREELSKHTGDTDTEDEGDDDA
ncbi:hypothetical protein EV121DRAFT_284527 [Schizophyllum commune]